MLVVMAKLKMEKINSGDMFFFLTSWFERGVHFELELNTATGQVPCGWCCEAAELLRVARVL